MKIICTFLAALLTAGCSAPVVLQRDRTRALSWSSKAPIERVWAATTNAVSKHPFTVMKVNREGLFISAGTPAGFGTDGELVGVWLKTENGTTRIDVSSKPISLFALGNTDWRHPIAQRICETLGEPTPPAPPPLEPKKLRPQNPR